jgi:hypothetical protein
MTGEFDLQSTQSAASRGTDHSSTYSFYRSGASRVSSTSIRGDSGEIIKEKISYRIVTCSHNCDAYAVPSNVRHLERTFGGRGGLTADPVQVIN